MSAQSIRAKIQTICTRLQELENEKIILETEHNYLKQQLESLTQNTPDITHHTFTAEEKIHIFMDLFKGRTDVFPKRWENTTTGKFGYPIPLLT